MAIKISKAEFDALPDAVKAKFEADGDEYVLQEQDVEGLKKSKAEILEEKKRIQAERDELAKFKADKEAENAKAEEEKAKKAGEFEKVLEQKEKLWNERIEAEAQKNAKIMGTLHREQLKSKLVLDHKVLPDRVDYLANELMEQTEFAMSDNGFSLKKKGGIGDAAEFDAMINEAKQAKPFFFAANGASGSGASGSQQASGNAKTMPIAQFNAMGVREQAAFIKEGGKPVE